MSAVTKPIIMDETGQAIAEACERIAESLAEKKLFKFINSITLTEDSSYVEFTVDSNNNPISLQHVFVKVKFAQTIASAKWMLLKVWSSLSHTNLTNDGQTDNARGFAYNSTVSAGNLQTMECIRNYGIPMFYIGYANTNPGYAGGYMYRVGGERVLFGDDPFIKVRVESEVALAAGTVIEVYGVES